MDRYLQSGNYQKTDSGHIFAIRPVAENNGGQVFSIRPVALNRRLTDICNRASSREQMVDTYLQSGQ